MVWGDTTNEEIFILEHLLNSKESRNLGIWTETCSLHPSAGGRKPETQLQAGTAKNIGLPPQLPVRGLAFCEELVINISQPALWLRLISVHTVLKE